MIKENFDTFVKDWKFSVNRRQLGYQDSLRHRGVILDQSLTWPRLVSHMRSLSFYASPLKFHCVPKHPVKCCLLCVFCFIGPLSHPSLFRILSEGLKLIFKSLRFSSTRRGIPRKLNSCSPNTLKFVEGSPQEYSLIHIIPYSNA